MAPAYHPPGQPVAIEVNLVTAPDGRPAVCLQLPEGGYIILPRPEQVLALAAMLTDAAGDLKRAIAGMS